MKRRVLIALAALAVLVLAAQAGAAEQGFELRETTGATWPERSFVLTLPDEMSISAGAVQVREDGRLVRNASVVPAGEASGQAGVVLVIDASVSMRGDAIQGAVEAAKAFVSQLKPYQQVGVIVFNKGWSELLQLTSDQARIEAALASPPKLRHGTKIYDAVSAAVDLLTRANLMSGSIVLLSDGADTGSATSLESAGEAAADGRIRIFSVGLHGAQFEPDALRSLAARSGGDYSDAGTARDLAPIFDQLGQRLASEYVIHYRSAAEPGDIVHVNVRVQGLDGVAESAYTAPNPKSAGEPFHRSRLDAFLHSPASMVVVSLFSAVLIAFALVAIVRPRNRTVRARMAEFVSVLPADEGNAQRGSEFLARAEKSFEQTSWWPRFKENLEIAGIRMPAIQIVLWTAVATLFAMWFLFTVGGSIAFAPLGLGVPLVVRAAINRALERERTRFADQLPDNLQVLSSALRAGHSLVGALSVVVEDCPEPSRAEFRRVVADEQLGVPLEEALGVVARRMASVDLDQVALVSTLQRETGGNTAEVLDRVAENVRGRFELRRLVKTLTAQGRMSRWIVSFLPVGLLGLITLINPEYMEPLYTHAIGRVLLAIAALMVIAGSLVIKRIVTIKV
jgi:tight adherence protein B